MSDQNFTSGEFREALGRFATGVAVATCAGTGHGPVGVTINSFSSVSLTPPLVLWCLDKSSDREGAFIECGGFAINVLARAQQALSVRFAEVGQHDFTGIKYDTWVTGAPVLPGVLSAFDCELEARHDAGDHWILVGRVRKLCTREGEPLLYFRGSYRGLNPKH